MTKEREKLSPEQALILIASRIGLPEMAQISGRASRTVLDWSDPDTSAGVSFAHATAFDIAFRRAGGDHSPMHEAFGHIVRSALATEFAEEIEIEAVTILSIREAGEAHAAALDAVQPGAGLQEIDVAIREVAQSSSKFEALTAGLARLRALRRQKGGAVPSQPP